MSSPTKKRLTPQQRRMQIMLAAETLFIEQGVAATSIDDIVNAAGVAKGTFYLYFNSREQLLHSLQQQFMAAFHHAVELALAQVSAQDWAGKLECWFQVTLTGMLDNSRLQDALFYKTRTTYRHLSYNNPAINQLRTLLEDGIACKAWQHEAPQLLAIMIFHATLALADRCLDQQAQHEAPQLIHHLYQTFHQILTV